MNEYEFLKNSRPYLFSDSKIIKKGKLTRDFFSYFLETLTSSSKEKEFEDYCRKLIEVTICPNLLPQTGPTGGGDSKVDSETIPVSEALSESWLYGFVDNAHKERWAFAFSAKKDWKPKLKSDVKKIVDVNESLSRGYTKIFFVTNQFVSDKKRAEAEDSLRNEYQMDVRVLDKTWLLEKTFMDSNQVIAIKSFNMSEELIEEKDVGAKDIEREKRLNVIEDELKQLDEIKPAKIIKLSNELVILNRQLEVDKNTMIAVLERHIRFSKKYGRTEDHADALYEYYRTMLWWYVDREKAYEIYLEFEQVYKDNINNYSLLKKLLITWMPLYSNHLSGIKEIEDIEKHTKLLNNSFQMFISDQKNPNTALLARFDFQLSRIHHLENVPSIVNEYIEILQDIKFNRDINLNLLKELLEHPIFKEDLRYDELIELLIDLLGEQSKNISGARLLINRGNDLFGKSPYSAIRYYSRALSKLFNEESKEDLIEVCLRLGLCFEEIGLDWAARSFYIRVLMDSFNCYFFDGNVVKEFLLSSKALKYLELRIGRINHSLSHNEIEQSISEFYPFEINEEPDNHINYDVMIAIAMLNSDPIVITKLNKLPDYLEKVDLLISCIALKYKLGYSDEKNLESLGIDSSLEDLIGHLYNQANELEINVYDDFSEVVELKSKVLGCELSVKTPRNSMMQEFGATLLAMIENMFATSIADEIIPRISGFRVNIEELQGEMFSINFEQKYNTVKLSIVNPNEMAEPENREKVHENLNRILINFISQVLIRENDFEKLKKSSEDENAMFRCQYLSNTLDTFVAVKGFKSFEKKLDNENEYVNIRKEDVIGDNTKKVENNEIDNDYKFNFGSLPEGYFSKVYHNNMKMSDAIYIPLWDEAKWKGLFVTSGESFNSPAVIGLVFENSNGMEIFEHWKTQGIGSKVRVGIITGIDKNWPLSYRVIIGENIINTVQKNEEGSILCSMARLHTMLPENDTTIRLLKGIKKTHSKIYLAPFLLGELDQQKFRTELFIEKEINQIDIKDVSEINENDLFLIQGLMPTDNILNNTGKEIFAEQVIREKQNFVKS